MRTPSILKPGLRQDAVRGFVFDAAPGKVNEAG
jgi:hypothetical protein